MAFLFVAAYLVRFSTGLGHATGIFALGFGRKESLQSLSWSSTFGTSSSGFVSSFVLWGLYQTGRAFPLSCDINQPPRPDTMTRVEVKK
jgi:hypothetical protein